MKYNHYNCYNYNFKPEKNKKDEQIYEEDFKCFFNENGPIELSGIFAEEAPKSPKNYNEKKYEDKYEKKHEDKYEKKYEKKYEDKYENEYEDKYEKKHEDKYEKKYNDCCCCCCCCQKKYYKYYTEQ
ncbi:MAG: hypothetical protein N2749_05765 [Clostridia bacterium]|nr:hypothetical protein [Clostridia bacterium]